VCRYSRVTNGRVLRLTNRPWTNIVIILSLPPSTESWTRVVILLCHQINTHNSRLGLDALFSTSWIFFLLFDWTRQLWHHSNLNIKRGIGLRLTTIPGSHLFVHFRNGYFHPLLLNADMNIVRVKVSCVDLNLLIKLNPATQSCANISGSIRRYTGWQAPPTSKSQGFRGIFAIRGTLC
jgi:hypothetical protein